MKKVLSTVAALAFIVMGSSASALTIPNEWEAISPTNMVADGTQFTPGTDLGFYIWTDTEARMNWHIAMSGDGHPSHIFTGSIILENANGTFNTVKWENSDSLFVINNEAAAFFTVTNVHYDQIDITITNYNSPSYIGMDLDILGYGNNADMIFIGQDCETVASLGSDDDFRIAAPVPEPATLLLFGTGLASIAGLKRRHAAKK